MAKLEVKGLGLALGFTWALCIFVLGLSASLLNWGSSWIELLAVVYIGYEASLVGSIIGAIYGFVDGFIGGALIAWFYNRFAE